MKNLPLLLLVCLFGLLLPSCDDDNIYIPPEPVEETPLEKLDRLVPITQTGANRFGCLINGKVWRNQGGSVLQSDINSHYFTDSIRFTVRASRYSSNDNWSETQYLSFFEDDLTQSLGESYFPKRNSEAFRGRWGSPNYEGKYYLIDTSFNEVLITHVDEEVLSGSFQYLLHHEDTGEVLEVTNGRFDVSYLVF